MRTYSQCSHDAVQLSAVLQQQPYTVQLLHFLSHFDSHIDQAVTVGHSNVYNMNGSSTTSTYYTKQMPLGSKCLVLCP